MRKDYAHCEQYAFQVEPKRALLYVLDIVHYLLLRPQIETAGDLRQPCESRLDLQTLAEAVYVGLELFVEAFALRSRADKAHLTGQYLRELRQLVHSGTLQKLAERGYPLVVLAVGLLRAVILSVGVHRTELYYLKAHAVLAEPLLLIQDASWRGQLYNDRYDKHRDKQHDKCEKRKHYIKKALKKGVYRLSVKLAQRSST